MDSLCVDVGLAIEGNNLLGPSSGLIERQQLCLSSIEGTLLPVNATSKTSHVFGQAATVRISVFFQCPSDLRGWP